MNRLLVAAPLLLLASSAFAADAIVDVPASVGEWNGFYAGVQLGGAFGNDTGVFTLDRNGNGLFGDFLPAFNAGPGTGFSGDFNDGFIGGVHVGYDMQFGQFVVGGILDFSGTDIGDRESGFSSTPAFYHIDRDLDFLGTARIRLGYTVTDRILAYATGGLAYGDIDYSFVSNTPAVSVISGDSDSDIGYTVGGGIEAKVTDRISVGLEYLYTNLGGNDYNVRLSGPAAFSGPGSAGFTGPGNNGFTNARGSDDDFDFHTVQVKLSYHF